jgi:hypothetical protein
MATDNSGHLVECPGNGELETVSQFADEPGANVPPPDVFLVVRRGEHVSLVDLSEPGERTIGRAPGVEIFLDDPRVSRKHAKIRRTGTHPAVPRPPASSPATSPSVMPWDDSRR